MSRAREFADLAGSADAGGLTGRNLIINGAMQVAQRGTSFAQAGGATTYNFAIDRFKYEQAIEQWAGTMSQSTDVPSSLDASFKYSLKIQTTTVETTIDADDFAQIVYYFEGNDGERLAYGTSNARVSTLSFYVRSSVTGTYCLGLSNQDGSRTLPLEYTVSVADTWQRIELTVPACIDGTWGTGSNKHLGIRWMLGKPGTNFDGGTNGVWASDSGYAKLYTDQSNMVDWLRTASSTLYITGVQLEVGEQATPFEHEPFETTEKKCFRYFQRRSNSSGYSIMGSGGHWVNATTPKVPVFLHPRMRAAPTFSSAGSIHYVYGAGLLAASTATPTLSDNTTGWSGLINGTTASVGTTGDHTRIQTNNAAGNIDFDAEL